MDPSHRITDSGGKVVIHDLEVFCAYDPRIDGESDKELMAFDNERVAKIVASTREHMERGSYPQLVVLHEKRGDEPKSAVGRFTSLRYEDRDGVGYIVGDCEVERDVFDRLLATNAFPRRSAEIWQEQNHLSEVALLGRETPRRPLPDTHFHRAGTPVRFSRSMRFAAGVVGGGLSDFIPSTKDTNMADTKDDGKDDGKAMLAEMKKLYEMACAKFGSDGDDGSAKSDDSDDKADNAAEDMLHTQFGAENADSVDEDADDAKTIFPAAREGDMIAMRRENAKMARELADIRAQLTAERFGRELDLMESEGYRIPAAKRPSLIAQLVAAREPETLIESWRELFARDATGVRIDMGRASMGAQDITKDEIAALVKQFAGNPAEFSKAINARTKR